MDTRPVLYSSFEAARYATNIEGWIDQHDRFWGKEEHMARWSGCTHILCPECGKPTPKNYTKCDECREKKAVERYKNKERVQWDRQTPLYSEAADEYFFDEDSLNDYLEDHECTPQSLRLVNCRPIYFREIEDDLFADELPEDGCLPLDVERAIDNLNILLREQGPVSWEPGKYAVEV